MSKGNLFLGFGRGKVGDVVFSRQNGEQVTRARNRSPKNPKTALQLAQRVVMKTNSLAYSLVQDIANHSFQGFAEGTESQSQFTKRNVELLRAVIADEINSGDPKVILNSLEVNFATNAETMAPVNPYIISEGKIPTIPVSFGDPGTGNRVFFIPRSTGAETPTYQQIVDLLGLQQGDQLTFCFFSYDDVNGYGTFNGFDYARVILEPSDGDMTKPFLSDGAVNLPNVKNEGSVTLAMVGDEAPGVDPTFRLSMASPKFVTTAGQVNTVVGCAVIASRLAGGIWSRSTQSIVLRPGDGTGAVQNDYRNLFLGDAVRSFMSSTSSSLYLNQSE